ncbi:hypothetical protein B0O99DRAFT_684396 [Bisporella sp. PMI_857]|nr:hypothetical protein B0O99DRAFT_684396 [Bisporella sp. PMI_857]
MPLRTIRQSSTPTKLPGEKRLFNAVTSFRLSPSNPPKNASQFAEFQEQLDPNRFHVATDVLYFGGSNALNHFWFHRGTRLWIDNRNTGAHWLSIMENYRQIRWLAANPSIRNYESIAQVLGDSQRPPNEPDAVQLVGFLGVEELILQVPDEESYPVQIEAEAFLNPNFVRGMRERFEEAFHNRVEELGGLGVERETNARNPTISEDESDFMSRPRQWPSNDGSPSSISRITRSHHDPIHTPTEDGEGDGSCNGTPATILLPPKRRNLGNTFSIGALNHQNTEQAQEEGESELLVQTRAELQDDERRNAARQGPGEEIDEASSTGRDKPTGQDVLQCNQNSDSRQTLTVR